MCSIIQIRISRTQVYDWGVSPFGFGTDAQTMIYPKPGFQNAPKFCENTDKALATYTFEVPNIATGNKLYQLGL